MLTVPRAQPVVLELLRTAHPGVTIHSRLDPDALAKLPYVLARFGERQIHHARLRLVSPLTLYVMVRGDDAAADTLSAALYQTLETAAGLKTPIGSPPAYLGAFEVRAWPADSPLPGQPSGITRQEATYLVGIRPASVTP
ncbi:hypothetical protein [Saccharothrix lopnurensis]|uniref:Uncharacterized protein n=1 Tax=Saccharothrix lopnurensis TaxID=1670621 RepID=A0ABW1P6F9_9PSEU